MFGVSDLGLDGWVEFISVAFLRRPCHSDARRRCWSKTDQVQRGVGSGVDQWLLDGVFSR